MKRIYLFASFLLVSMGFVFTSCDSDDDLSSTSVFAGDTIKTQNEFDKWIVKNYLTPYNIDFQYRYNDKLTDQTYNVIPADYDKSVALAILVKHMWLDAYSEAFENVYKKDAATYYEGKGMNFLRAYSFRQMQLIGSNEYSSNGSIIQGSAEGGLKIMLYGVNRLDIDNPRINVEDPYEDREEMPIDMNYWFFHTMHHEFCHILTQKKSYSTDYQTITAGSYHSQDWVNLKDSAVQKEGFVTAYGSSEYNEDFAEMYATYVTMTPDAWQMILDKAGKEGAALLESKLSLVRSYFSENWGLDIDEMRDIVLRRSSEALLLNLRDLEAN